VARSDGSVPGSAAGITLVELLFGLFLAALVAGLIAVAVSRASAIAAEAVLRNRLAVDAQRLETQLAGELRRSAADLIPIDGQGSELIIVGADPRTTISFRVAEGFDESTGRIAWSANAFPYAFVPDAGEVALNGVDDDGDGLVDEGSIHRDGRPFILGVTRFACRLLHDGLDNDGDGLRDEIDEPHVAVAVEFRVEGTSGGRRVFQDHRFTVDFRSK